MFTKKPFWLLFNPSNPTQPSPPGKQVVSTQRISQGRNAGQSKVRKHAKSGQGTNRSTRAQQKEGEIEEQDNQTH